MPNTEKLSKILRMIEAAEPTAPVIALRAKQG
jgi:hypothetical protein